MNFLKIIFLFGIFLCNSYAAGWADHALLVHMSWRVHWEEALERMEGDNALTQDQRTRVLERFAQGRGRTHGLDLNADLNQAAHPNVGTQIQNNNLPQNYLDNELVWQWSDVDMVEVLESGIIPMKPGYRHQARDRRWTAGWILNTMDIIRQQPITNHLFDEDQYGDINNNDLLKVRGLSGTFGQWGDQGFVEQFSGMIQSGQRLRGGNTTVNIISCFHGVWNKHLNTLYFLPKGKAPLRQNLFQVQSVRIRESTKVLNQGRVDELSQRWNNLAWGALFQQDDYAIIQVNNIAVEPPITGGRNNSLNDILRHRDLLLDAEVISLQGEDPEEDFNPNRILAFGKPLADFFAGLLPDEDSFCLVSDVSNGNAMILNNPNLVHPRRRLDRYEQLYNRDPPPDMYDNIHGPTPLNNKQAVSIPMAPGMSGGPVLQCQIEVGRIRCRLLGVAHGINLIQENDHISFKGLIARQQEIVIQDSCCVVS